AATDEVRTGDWARVKTLLLAVEILSASSRRADRFTKRRIYQEAGVACYWVVDLDEKAIEAWTPDATFPAVEREQVVWRPAGATDALVIPIAEILPPACTVRPKASAPIGDRQQRGAGLGCVRWPRSLACRRSALARGGRTYRGSIRYIAGMK